MEDIVYTTMNGNGSTSTPTPYNKEKDADVSRILILSDEELIEGIIGSLVFVLFRYILIHVKHENIPYILAMIWFFIWILRKFSVRLFVYLKRQYDIRNYNLNLIL